VCFQLYLALPDLAKPDKLYNFINFINLPTLSLHLFVFFVFLILPVDIIIINIKY